MLKHIQINSQFQKILLLKVRLSFFGGTICTYIHVPSQWKIFGVYNRGENVNDIVSLLNVDSKIFDLFCYCKCRGGWQTFRKTEVNPFEDDELLSNDRWSERDGTSGMRNIKGIQIFPSKNGNRTFSIQYLSKLWIDLNML